MSWSISIPFSLTIPLLHLEPSRCWSVTSTGLKMSVSLCCVLWSLPDPNSSPVLPNEKNRFQSHHLLGYWCSHVYTGIRLYASVVSECVIPHLLLDAHWPLSLGPFWKNPAWDPNTHTHTVHVSLPLTLFCPTSRMTKVWQYYTLRAGYLNKYYSNCTINDPPINVLENK